SCARSPSNGLSAEARNGLEPPGSKQLAQNEASICQGRWNTPSRSPERETAMEFTTLARPTPALGSAFSVVLAERVFRQADVLGLPDAWARRPLGHPTRRRTAYRSEHRAPALLPGWACGLRAIAPGNTFLRPTPALQARLGGRFPDQGTIHHWLAQISDAQATAVRDHLHQVVRQHGHFWEVLWSADLLVVDVDGQGLVARGQRFERAAKGWLGAGIDRRYHPYLP